MSSNTRVALCGVGIMGTGMAGRLLGAGFPLTVYNRTPAKAAALAGVGAKIAATPAAAADGAGIIVSMVADDAASRSVWLGENGALSAAGKGATLIECSTLSFGWVQELAQAARARGCELLDAPVTGSKKQAANGELSFLVGGSTAALELARPALAVMSRAIIHLGPTGSGALLKLVNNFLGGVQVASFAEAMALIERCGLQREQAVEVLKNGAPGSPLVKTMADRMTSRDYTPNFMTRLMAKDLGYARAEAGRHGLDFGTAAAALEVFRKAMARGDGDKDMAAIVEQFRSSSTANPAERDK